MYSTFTLPDADKLKLDKIIELRARLLRMPIVTLKEATEQGLATEEVKRHSFELNSYNNINVVSQCSGYNNSSCNNNNGGMKITVND